MCSYNTKPTQNLTLILTILNKASDMQLVDCVYELSQICCNLLILDLWTDLLCYCYIMFIVFLQWNAVALWAWGKFATVTDF